MSLWYAFVLGGGPLLTLTLIMIFMPSLKEALQHTWFDCGLDTHSLPKAWESLKVFNAKQKLKGAMQCTRMISRVRSMASPVSKQAKNTTESDNLI